MKSALAVMPLKTYNDFKPLLPTMTRLWTERMNKMYSSLPLQSRMNLPVCGLKHLRKTNLEKYN